MLSRKNKSAPAAATPGQEADAKPKINYHDLDYRIGVAHNFTDRWQQYFTFFGEGFEGRRIREQEEAAFSEIIMGLAASHYQYCEVIGALLAKSHKKNIMNIICETVSLSHIKGVSVSEYNTLMQDWHMVFIFMNKALGHLLAEKHREEEKRRTKEEIKNTRGKKPKKGETAEPAAPTPTPPQPQAQPPRPPQAQPPQPQARPAPQQPGGAPPHQPAPAPRPPSPTTLPPAQ